VGEPSVVAIVVNWNGRELLEPCVSTLLASTYRNLSVVVVDNASTDGSQDFVRSRFPTVRLIENERNLRYAGGANAGVRLALGENADYVFVLNNDTEIAAGTVAALVEAARGHPRAAFLGPMIYYADAPTTIWSFGGVVSYWTGNIRHVGIREVDRGQYPDVLGVDYVTGCALMGSAAAIRAVGLMDEGYFMYNEDTDWCVRAAKLGYSVLAVPGAKVWHRVSMSSGGGLSSFKVYHRFRSTLRFFGRHARAYQWVGIVPASAARTLGFIARQLVSGRPSNARAVISALIDSARRERRG
jgi:GT2 family glycosyltransferase